MKKILSTIVVCAGFLTMLTATSKKRVPREAGSIPKLTIPATTGWNRHEMAGIRFFAPPGSLVERTDELGKIVIKLKSGYEVRFEAMATDISKNPQHEFHMYYAPDAQISLFESRGGDECHMIACTTKPIMGSPLCMNAPPRNSNEECAQLVALVRSIEPL